MVIKRKLKAMPVDDEFICYLRMLMGIAIDNIITARESTAQEYQFSDEKTHHRRKRRKTKRG